MTELRLAFRRLRQRPGATSVSILTLAAAMGAAVATWSLVSAVLLRPLPIRDTGRLVVIGQLTTIGPRAGSIYDGLTYPNLHAFGQSGVFEHVAAEWTPMTLLTRTPEDAAPSRDTIGFVTWDLFSLLGVQTPIGRGFTAADDRRGAPLVGILTDSYWHRRYDRRIDVLGRTILVAGKAVTIVGVGPRGFRGLELATPIDVYLPFHTVADVGSPLTNYFANPSHQSSPTSGTKIVARTRPNASREQDAARLSAIAAAGQSRRTANPALVLTPLDIAAIPSVARPDMKRFARLLAMTVGSLLLIGCGTVGMLLLTRTEARRDELAMCLALGATSSRLTAGIVVEGTVLALAGALLSVPVATWLFRGVAAFQLPGNISIERLALGIDLRALLIAAAIAAAASVAISIVGASLGLGGNIPDSLRSRSGATPRMARRRTRTALVVAQIATAMALVAGAGLFARSLAAALGLNAGLDMGRVLTGSINLAPYGYDAARATAFFDDLHQRLAGNPAVASVSYAVERGGMLGKMDIDGAPRQFSTQVGFLAVDESYFRTLGIRVSDGRDFTRLDAAGAPPVMLVSASLARAMSADGRALGARVTMPFRHPGRPPDVVEVVGVVDDVVTRVTDLQPLTMYFPIAQIEGGTSRSFMIRSAATGGSGFQREVMAAIRSAGPAVIPSQVMTIEERIVRQMAPQEFSARVLGTLGGIALLLTLLGIYVLGESMAAIRMREMGIRAALGATRRQLAAIVVRETARLVGLGLAAGLALTWLAAGTVKALLFRIQPLDPLTLAAVAGSILTLAFIVSVRPALRAARVDVASMLKDV